MDNGTFPGIYFGYGALQNALAVPIPDAHQAADIFAPNQPPSPAIHDCHNSAVPVTSQPTFNMSSVPARRASMDASEDGTENSRHKVLNPLDDGVSDEFGLSSTGPGGGKDLGGKPKEDKSEAAPPWSELKTKAGKERKRLPLACIACRRKKIRCSGEKPACKHCLRSRVPCVYKVTTRKAAPRTDYMAMLDKRLKRMEERIIKIIPKAEQETVSSTVPRAVVKPGMPGTLQPGTGSKRKQGEEMELEQWAAHSQSTCRVGYCGNKVQHLELEDSDFLTQGSKALPDKEMQEHLANVFFENIYGQAYLLLHKPSYMRKLRSGTLPPVLILSVCAVAARFSGHPKLGATANFLRGEEWAREARDIVTRRYEWPSMTILTCLLILGLHEFGTCQGGRSWALAGQATRMAFALQLHKDLEYDPASPDGSPPLSFIDREIRRRTMWSCFIMDKFTSSGTDRPIFIRDETMNIPLPMKEKYFQLDMPGPTETLYGKVLDPVSADDGRLANAKENMGVAAYMIRAIALWGRIINHHNQGGREADHHPPWDPESRCSKLRAEADEFWMGLPDPLLYSDENLRLHDTENVANQYLFLHILMQQNILFVNCQAMSASQIAVNLEASNVLTQKAREKAFSSANRISDLLREAENHFVSAPLVGYCAFLSSTVHITGLYSSGGGDPELAEKQKKNLAINIRYLGKMKRFWGMFHWVVENLREQYKMYHDATRVPPPGNNPLAAVGGCLSPVNGRGGPDTPTAVAGQSPVFQYVDWLDRYSHGISNTDFIGQAAPKKKKNGEDAVLEQKPELHTVEEYLNSLSSTQSEDVRTVNDQGGQGNLKRKGQIGFGARQTKRARPLVQVEPLMMDFGEHAQAQLHAQQQRHLHAFPLGDQRSNTANFNPSTISHTTSGNGYHAPSPVSPITAHHDGSAFPVAGASHAYAPAHYPTELLSTLQQSAGLESADRHMSFGGYSGNGVQDSQNAGVVDGSGHRGSNLWETIPSCRNATGAPGVRNTVANGFGVDSTAWFSPFNMDADLVSLDILGGNAMDSFNIMGGNANNGSLTTPSIGLHHGN